jgi:hypothetical protein
MGSRGENIKNKMKKTETIQRRTLINGRNENRGVV